MSALSDLDFLSLFPLPEGVSLFSITHREHGQNPRWSIFVSYRSSYRSEAGQNYIGVYASGEGASLAEAHAAAYGNIQRKRAETDALRATWSAQRSAERARARAIEIDLSDLGI